MSDALSFLSCPLTFKYRSLLALTDLSQVPGQIYGYGASSDWGVPQPVWSAGLCWGWSRTAGGGLRALGPRWRRGCAQHWFSDLTARALKQWPHLRRLPLTCSDRRKFTLAASRERCKGVGSVSVAWARWIPSRKEAQLESCCEDLLQGRKPTVTPGSPAVWWPRAVRRACAQPTMCQAELFTWHKPPYPDLTPSTCAQFH